MLPAMFDIPITGINPVLSQAAYCRCVGETTLETWNS